MTNNIPLPVDAIKAVEQYNKIKDCLKIDQGLWKRPPFIDPFCPGPCLLDASPSLDFGPRFEGVQDSRTFMVSNLGVGTLEWKATVTKEDSKELDWINLGSTNGTGSEISGTISGTGFEMVNVLINTTKLSLENHNATVKVSSNCGEKTGTISVNIIQFGPT